MIKNFLNPKQIEKTQFTGTVSQLYPLEVKIFDTDDAISCVSVNNLSGLVVGSKVLMTKIGNQFIVTNVIGNDSLCKCVLNKTSTQSIPDSTETSIEFGSGTEIYDPLDMHDTSTNPERITIPKDGLYIVNVGGGFAAAANGSRIIYIVTSGGGSEASLRMLLDSANHWRGSLSKTIEFSENDYVRFRAYQSSGGNLNIGGTSVYQLYFSVIKT